MKNNNSFWNRYFTVAVAGHFFMFMTISLLFLFPIYLQKLGASEGRIGLIMGTNSIVVIFVRPLVGRMIDRKGRKRISLIGLAILVMVFPFFLLIRDAGWLPIVLRAVTGLGWGVAMTAIITMCSDLAPAGKLGHSMGIIGIGGLLAQALGPLVGEEIIHLWGFNGLFIACILLSAVSFVCIAATPELNSVENNGEGGKVRLLDRATVWVLFIICAFIIVHGAVRGSVIYFISLFIRSLRIERVSPFFLAFSTAAIFTRIFLGGLSDRHGRKKIIIPAALLLCLNFLLITCIRGSWMVLLAGFVGGFGQGLIYPALTTYVMDFLGRNHKGLAIGLYLTLFDIGMGAGSPFFGWISDTWGFRPMFRAAGVIFFIAVLAFTLKAPKLKPE